MFRLSRRLGIGMELVEEYGRNVGERLSEARLTVREGTSVNNMYRVFKDVVNIVAAEVIGYRVCKGRQMGNAWWIAEIRETVVGKRRADKKMIQKNVVWETRERRNEY